MLINTMLLLLSRFSRVRFCVTPQTAAHQAPLSLGFSRKEHWSGLPFPSPTHACLLASVMLSRFSHVQLYVTLWIAAHQAPLSTGFSMQEYWSGLPSPSPDNHNNTRIKYKSIAKPPSRILTIFHVIQQKSKMVLYSLICANMTQGGFEKAYFGKAYCVI